MSLKFGDAAESAKALLVHSELAGTSTTIAGKNNWETQVIGAYDLIFPHLHLDIPTRIEVQAALQQTMTAHHMTPHFGKKSHPGGFTAAVLTAVDPNVASGGPGTVRAIGNNVLAKGYGVG